MSDYIISLVRTWVPILVGTFLTWLGMTTGIVLPENMPAELAATATAVVTGVYYALARLLESRWPWLGWLLGSPRTPVYEPPVPDAATRLGASRYDR